MAFQMKTTAAGGNGGSVKAPPGNHLAVLVGIFEMGTQEDTFDQTKARRKVYLVWELVGERIAGTAKNHVVSAAVTQSLNEKATLRKWVESRRGSRLGNDDAYDLTAELGQACMLNVVANDKGYPRVEGVAAVPKGTPVPKATYTPVAVSLDEYQEAGDACIPEWVPWLYGSPLSDHIDACEEIGGKKPVPRKKAEGGGATPPDDGRRWDASDGTTAVLNQSTAEVQALVNTAGDPAKIRIKPAGSDKSQVKTADQFGFKVTDAEEFAPAGAGDPIPF